MKNVFGINAEKENLKIEGYLFVERRLDADLSKKQDKCQEKLDQYQKKARPKGLETLKNICFYAFLFCLFLVVRFLLNEDKNEVAIVVTACIGIILLLSSLFIIIYIKSVFKKIVDSEDFKNTLEESKEIYEKSLKELKIPENAQEIDVLLFMYREKDGVKKSVSQFFEFLNFNCHIFSEDDKLMIADTESVLAFYKNSFKSIEKVERKISVSGWNKEFGINEGKFKDYKLTVKNGVIFMPYYYAVKFEYQYEEYEFFIPPYEFDIVEKYIKVNEENAE